MDILISENFPLPSFAGLSAELYFSWLQYLLCVAEMRMLHWMSGHTRQDRLGMNELERKLGLLIVEKMVESHSRWLGHVWRRLVETSLRKSRSDGR